MLSVIIIWIYMLFTTFLTGYGIRCLLTRFVPYRVRHMDTYLVCGLAGVTVYAQVISLFGRVGAAANLILCAACVLTAWLCRRTLGSVLRNVWNNIWGKQAGKRGKMFGILFLFFLFAYGTSRGIIHYDTGLYHAQSIRWIEEYGVVKGLGNLHCRLAYNSASFALSALYSMAFLGGQSYHCAAGFLAWTLSKVCMEMAGSLQQRRLRISDFARVMGFYYLVIIFDEMVSPASDYFMVLFAFYIIIRFLELAEHEVKEIFPYALLCVLGVYLMTVKLSAAFILLLVIYPAYYLIRNRRWREMALYLSLGIVTALPFFIRNVLLSGWLVYPFTQMDLFETAWKIPKGVADYDAKEIQVWGRGYTDVARYDISVKEWLPDWFRSLAGSDKLLVMAAVVSLAVLLVYGIGMLCGWWRRRPCILLIQVTVAASFVFWLCTSPLIRYGCVYVYLMSAVVFGGVYDAVLSAGEAMAARRHGVTDPRREGRRVRQEETVQTVCDDRMREAGSRETGAGEPGWSRVCRLGVWAAVWFLFGYKCAALGGEIAGSFVNDYWIVQKDYENYETRPYEMGGVTFYYPVNGDQAGYAAFPSAPAQTEVRFLGEGIEDGFAAVEAPEKQY